MCNLFPQYNVLNLETQNPQPPTISVSLQYEENAKMLMSLIVLIF